jgi:hypothetical protein
MTSLTPELGDLDKAALEKLGIRYRVHPDFDLDLLNDEASRAAWNQARLGDPIDDDHVDELVAELERGASFPPLIYYQDDRGRHVTLSGNHRREAYRRVGQHEAPAYEAAGLEGLRVEDDRVLILLYEANHGHGKPVALEDRVEQAVTLIERGMTVRSAAAALGVPENRLRDHYEAARATRRLEEELGVSTDEIPITAQRRLANIRSDRVAREAATLVPFMDRKTQEVNELVKAINSERAEDAQLQVISDYREMLRDRSPGTAPNRFPTAPPEVRRFDTAIGTILRFDTELLRSGISLEIRDRLVERVRECRTKPEEAEAVL